MATAALGLTGEEAPPAQGPCPCPPGPLLPAWPPLCPCPWSPLCPQGCSGLRTRREGWGRAEGRAAFPSSAASLKTPPPTGAMHTDGAFCSVCAKNTYFFSFISPVLAVPCLEKKKLFFSRRRSSKRPEEPGTTRCLYGHQFSTASSERTPHISISFALKQTAKGTDRPQPDHTDIKARGSLTRRMGNFIQKSQWRGTVVPGAARTVCRRP